MNDLTAAQNARVEVIAPLAQEGTQAVVRTWLKQTGDTVRQDEPIVELETDKVVVEVASPCDGTLAIVLAEGHDAAPGAVLGRVQRCTSAAATEAAEHASPSDDSKVALTPAMRAHDPSLRLSPSVRRLLSEHDLDPMPLMERGTGRGGRLTRQDVVAALAERAQPETPVVGRSDSLAAPLASPEPKALSTGLNADAAAPHLASTQVPHSRMRRTIAERMQHSVSTAPHVTAVFELDFTAIIAHRQRHKAAFAEQGVNLTYTAYFVAAAAQAMAVVPEVNSRWHADYLEVFKDVNIGVGTALGDKGLIVPVITQVQTRSLLGIATRLQALTEAARTGTLKPTDVQGGTFTISNHGVSGSLFASPIIINQPQSAILGIGALEKRVVVRELDGVEVFQARPRAYVSLTVDHRVLDGSQTNAWLTRFVETLHQWPDNQPM